MTFKLGDIALYDPKGTYGDERNWAIGIIVEISNGSCIIDVHRSHRWPGTRYLLVKTETADLDLIGNVLSIFPEAQMEIYLNERVGEYQKCMTAITDFDPDPLPF